MKTEGQAKKKGGGELLCHTRASISGTTESRIWDISFVLRRIAALLEREAVLQLAPKFGKAHRPHKFIKGKTENIDKTNRLSRPRRVMVPRRLQTNVCILQRILNNTKSQNN